MSLFGLFDIGKSALFASQTALDVTSHNIANANTPNFSRQEAILEIATPVSTRTGFLGRGVTVSSVRRHFDRFLEAQLLGQKQNFGRAAVLEDVFSQLEEIFNEQNGVGLSTKLIEYLNAWHDVANNPQLLTQRTALLQNADNLVSESRQIENWIENMIQSIDREVPIIIESINTMAVEISRLNERIAQVEGGSPKEANDLRDSRDKLLSDLNELVNIETLEDSSGRVTVIVGQRNLVSGSIVHSIAANKTVDGQFAITLENTDITDRIVNGKLSGLLDSKDTMTNGALKDFRRLIAAITNEVNIVHSRGFALNAQITDFSINDITGQKYTSTQGVIQSATITDFNSFSPGDYVIQFNAGATQYDVYKNGQLVSSGNTYSAPSVLTNGMTITFSGGNPPQGNDIFHVSAQGEDFFNPPSVYTLNKTSSNANITSTAIFDRTALAYDEYEIRFTSPTAYDVYNINDGTTIINSATYSSGGSIYFDGIEVVITNGTGSPQNGDIFFVSPLENAVENFNVAITDSDDIAAAKTSSGLPGDNENALDMIGLFEGDISLYDGTIIGFGDTSYSTPGLGNATFNDFYNGIVMTTGTLSGAAKDSLAFEETLLNEMQFKREAVSGVNLDEEAINLIKFQKAYEAGARLISITDELLEIVLNL